MKKLFLSCAIALLLTSCSNFKTDSDKIEQEKQEQLILQANSQVGLPAINNFQEKKLMKMIYELRDQTSLICYVYTFSEMTGKFTYLGKCLGYGLPYASQFSNPVKIKRISMEGIGSIEQLPQSEPNGLFMPSSADATWLLMLDEKGVPHPVYMEPKIMVSPFKLSL